MTRLIEIKNTWWLHPILIIFFFLIHETNEGFSSDFNFTILVIVGLIFFSITFYVIVYFVNSQKTATSFLLTYILGFLLFYRYIKNDFSDRTLLIQISFLIIFLLFFYWSFEKKRIFVILTTYLNTLFLVLIIIEIGIFINTKHKSENATQTHFSTKHFKVNNPNIYLLFLDGYAQEENLKKYWGFDNNLFTKSLIKSGFYEIDSSFTNYNSTIETVTSMFTQSEHKKLWEFRNNKAAQKEADKRLFFDLNKNEKIVNKFQKAGYTFINLSTFDIAKTAPLNFQMGFWLHSILRNTIFISYQKIPILGNYLMYLTEMNRFSILENVINKNNSSQFVYFHSLLTHAPFILDSTMYGSLKVATKFEPKSIEKVLYGDSINLSIDDKIVCRTWRQSYINHLRLANSLIIKTIKQIQHQDKNAIIVLMSDHGSRFLCDKGYNIAFNEGFQNIAYVYFPNKSYKGISKKLNPTELLKIVQDKVLTENLSKVIL